MRKHGRLLAFILAFSLSLTTFKTDFYNLKVYAAQDAKENPYEEAEGPSSEVSEEATESEPDPIPEPTPIIIAANPIALPVGQVLGAGGEYGSSTEEGAAVLGERKSITDDNTDTRGRILTIIAAATIAFIMIYIKRKNGKDK